MVIDGPHGLAGPDASALDRLRNDLANAQAEVVCLKAQLAGAVAKAEQFGLLEARCAEQQRAIGDLLAENARLKAEMEQTRWS